MSSILDRIKALFSRDVQEPVATPPEGVFGDEDRETSTNAQLEGTADEPWNS